MDVTSVAHLLHRLGCTDWRMNIEIHGPSWLFQRLGLWLSNSLIQCSNRKKTSPMDWFNGNPIRKLSFVCHERKRFFLGLQLREHYSRMILQNFRLTYINIKYLHQQPNPPLDHHLHETSGLPPSHQSSTSEGSSSIGSFSSRPRCIFCNSSISFSSRIYQGVSRPRRWFPF